MINPLTGSFTVLPLKIIDESPIKAIPENVLLNFIVRGETWWYRMQEKMREHQITSRYFSVGFPS
jgi:hypothetical protein